VPRKDERDFAASFFGFVEAVSEAAAVEAAVVLFALDVKRRRLAVNLRR
jgi:hypothetical protein